MSEAQLAFQLGQISFSGEGSEEWVAKQLEQFLAKIPEISGLAQSADGAVEAPPKQPKTPTSVGSLASYIKQKGGEKNQVKRFLATADWLRIKGEKNLKTALVSKALRDNQQKKLRNPSQSLANNLSQGFCEKTGSGFYITPEGFASLGHDGIPTTSPDEEIDQENGSDDDAVEPKAKKRVVRQPPPGSSCRDRINTLKADGFFKEPKTPADIVKGLGIKGWTHNSAQVGASLTIMFSKGEIQRTKDGGSFRYFWDRD